MVNGVEKSTDVKRKMYFKGNVIKIALAGAFVDIGLDKPGVLHISQMRKEHVKRVEEILMLVRKLMFGCDASTKKLIASNSQCTSLWRWIGGI
jgi:ribosomal protein S1